MKVVRPRCCHKVCEERRWLGWPRASVICLFSLPTQSEPAAMRPGMIGGARPCVSGKPENASRHPFGPTHPQTHLHPFGPASIVLHEIHTPTCIQLTCIHCPPTHPHTHLNPVGLASMVVPLIPTPTWIQSDLHPWLAHSST